MEGHANVWQEVSRSSADLGPIVGIDFGTSNSAIAVWHMAKNRPKVIRNAFSYSQRTTPSTVVFDGNDVKIGLTAEETSLHVVEGCKLLLGMEPSDEATDDDAMQLVRGRSDCFYRGNQLCVRNMAMNDSPGQTQTQMQTSLTVEEVAARIMLTLKLSAELYLKKRPAAWQTSPTSPTSSTDSSHNSKKNSNGDSSSNQWDGVLRRVVVGIPANYTDRKKQATRRAAALAGFTEVHLLVESSAAALAYGLLVVGRKDVLVVDMGCGTLDTTAMRIEEGGFAVCATGGVRCGGR